MSKGGDLLDPRTNQVLEKCIVEETLRPAMEMLKFNENCQLWLVATSHLCLISVLSAYIVGFTVVIIILVTYSNFLQVNRTADPKAGWFYGGSTFTES